MNDINYGGASKMFSFLANELSELNNQVYVYTYDGNKPNYQLNEMINYYTESKVSKNKLIKRILPIINTRKIIKKIQPDIVISFLPNANFYSVLGALGTCTSTIITERSDPYSEQGLILNLKRFFYRFAEGAVFQTDGAKEYYSNSIQNKSIVIQNPVTMKENARIDFEKRRNEIVHVARFDIKQKRQDIMLLAFKKVAEEIPNIKLVFYGDGPDLIKIKSMVKNMDLSHRVIFKGKSDQILKSIKDSKLFVLTSDFEGIPNALVEAMALGLPVIATDCSPGGARLLVENGINGLIVPRGDIESLSQSIMHLEQNPKEADKISLEATKVRTKYSADKIILKWNNYIEKVLKDHEKK